MIKPLTASRGITMHELAHKTLINRKTLLRMVPLSDRTIYNLEQRGEFPRRIVLTSRSVAWDLTEVENWIEEKRRSALKAARPGFIW